MFAGNWNEFGVQSGLRRTVADAMVLGLSQDEVCDLIGGTVEKVLGFAG